MATEATTITPPLRLPVTRSDRIIIVGAGVFGLSTARELSKRGYTEVKVLDRYLPPVPDGSSVDISRVIRPDYADDFYAKLGLEAMKEWETEYSPFFHKSGLLCATQDKSHPYLEESKENLRKLGQNVQSYEGEQAREQYPMLQGDLSNTRGYWNTSCGWANAEASIAYLARQCTLAGVSFITGSCGLVTSLITDGHVVRGVQTKSGVPVYGDSVILATGAWTPHLVDMNNNSVSDAQPVGFMQLTAGETREMEACPVIIDLSTGWFVFPPNPTTGVLKMARHGYGFEVMRQSEHRMGFVSAPALGSDNSSFDFIPEDAGEALRDGLALFFPKLKDRDFFHRRLCWYTDTPKGNFIVDNHPDYSNLLLATGGSGHAFKFLPILGRCIADAFESKASEEQKVKWRWSCNPETVSKGDGSRGGPPRRPLSKEEQAHLCED